MSYFPCDIPFMSDEELKENGIQIPKDVTDKNVGNNDYIRKQEAIDLINKISNLDLKAKGGICVSLANLKKADVVQVVHGKWIEEWWHGEKTRKCSVCNITQTVNVYKGEVKFKYCPYCGAKMDG